MKISKLLLALCMLFAFTTDMQSRHHSGWGGGWGFGIGLGYPGYGYGYPYYGYGYPYSYGYPYYGYGYPAYGYPTYRYPVRRKVIKRVHVIGRGRPQTDTTAEQEDNEEQQKLDNKGYAEWRILNTTKNPITAQGPTGPAITIAPNQFADVSHEDGWDLTIQYGNEQKKITTQKHFITVLQGAKDTLVIKDE